jgi:glycogen synthase
MRILMFGWEFPPHMSGGLGTACFGITKGLAAMGHEITFVLPRTKAEEERSHVELVSASEVPVPLACPEAGTSGDFGDGSVAGGGETPAPFLSPKLRVTPVASPLSPYLTQRRYEELVSGRRPAASRAKQPDNGGRGLLSIPGDYGPDLIAEVVRYGRVAGVIAGAGHFDVIHAHDWMTIPAGLTAKKASGVPLVLHIHALEFDRSGENVNQDIYDLERHGMEAADHIIAVSHYTKRMIVERYGIDPRKVTAVHNAVYRNEARKAYHGGRKKSAKLVLFLGRITFQKGPDYFIDAAARVLKALPEVKFVMAGAGDMMPRMIERVAELRLGRHFHFTGFLRGADIERIFTMSDLYVMPSVSEPFGISPLEAMMCDVPVIISRQSGVAEILKGAMKVDFWDVNEIANKIIAILKYPVLAAEVVARAREDLRSIHWDNAAARIVEVYRQVLHKPA